MHRAPDPLGGAGGMRVRRAAPAPAGGSLSASEARLQEENHALQAQLSSATAEISELRACLRASNDHPSTAPMQQFRILQLERQVRLLQSSEAHVFELRQELTNILDSLSESVANGLEDSEAVQEEATAPDDMLRPFRRAQATIKRLQQRLQETSSLRTSATNNSLLLPVGTAEYLDRDTAQVTFGDIMEWTSRKATARPPPKQRPTRPKQRIEPETDSSGPHKREADPALSTPRPTSPSAAPTPTAERSAGGVFNVDRCRELELELTTLGTKLQATTNQLQSALPFLAAITVPQPTTDWRRLHQDCAELHGALTHAMQGLTAFGVLFPADRAPGHPHAVLHTPSAPHTAPRVPSAAAVLRQLPPFVTAQQRKGERAVESVMADIHREIHKLRIAVSSSEALLTRYRQAYTVHRDVFMELRHRIAQQWRQVADWTHEHVSQPTAAVLAAVDPSYSPAPNTHMISASDDDLKPALAILADNLARAAGFSSYVRGRSEHSIRELLEQAETQLRVLVPAAEASTAEGVGLID